MKYFCFLKNLKRSKNGLILIIIATTIFVTSQFYLFISSTFDEHSINTRLGSVTDLPIICFNEPCLKKDSRLFTFPDYCQNISKETISSLERAKTKECRNYIVDTYCTHFNNDLYPSDLPYTCANKGASGHKGDYLGCYRDDFNQRIFLEHYKNLDDNSPLNCIHYCANAGFLYAGVQFKTECYCSSTMSRLETNLLLPNSNCSNICPEPINSIKKSTQSLKTDSIYATLKPIKLANRCGGYLALQIYTTGIGPRIFKPIEFYPKNSENINEPFKGQRIIFILTLSGRSVRQVVRMIGRIYRKHHFYYIHVDARQDYLYNELQLLLGTRFENIQFSKHRWATIWGGVSLLRMFIGCLDDLVRNFSHWKWDYVLNLSESDYPIKRVEEVEDFLGQNIGFNFLRSHEKDTPRFIKRQGMDMLFIECDEHMFRLGTRKVQKGIRVDGGSDWVALHKSFISYLFANADPALISWLISKNAVEISETDLLRRYYYNRELFSEPKFNPLKDINKYKSDNDASDLLLKKYPVEFNKEKLGINDHNIYNDSLESQLINGMISYWSYSLLPVESFFHTLLHNGAMCKRAINNNLHMTNWKRSRGCKCQHKHVVDWCGCSPNVFLSKDADRLISIKNRPDFFARKFDPNIDLQIINSVDEKLLDLNLKDFPSLTSHWENIFHFLDGNSKMKECEKAHINSLTALLKHTEPCLPLNLFQVEAFALFVAGKYEGVVVTFQVGGNISRLLDGRNINRSEDFPIYLDIFRTAGNSKRSNLSADYFQKNMINTNFSLNNKVNNIFKKNIRKKLNLGLNSMSKYEYKQILELKRQKRTIVDKPKQKIYMQALFKPSRFRKLFFHQPTLHRLLWAEVGMNFDPKELIFRNYVGFYGPESDLGIMVSWDGTDGEEGVLVCRLLDPDGLMVVEEEIGPDQNKATIVHESFDLVRPLKVGIWSVIFGDGQKWFSDNLHFLIHETVDSSYDTAKDNLGKLPEDINNFFGVPKDEEIVGRPKIVDNVFVDKTFVRKKKKVPTATLR